MGTQLATAIEHAALGGRIVLFGMNQTARPPIHQYTITERSLSVLGSYITAFTFPTAIRLVEAGTLPLDPIVTHVLPLDRVGEGLDLLRSGGATKVVITPGEAPAPGPVRARSLELGIYTDSLQHLEFEAALDVAAAIGATGIEIATGGQSSAPHLRIDELLGDATRAGRVRGRVRAPGPAHRRAQLLGVAAPPGRRRRARRAHPFDVSDWPAELGVRKIVSMSGCPGDGPAGSTVNFAWYPWPADAVAMLERQWAHRDRPVAGPGA